MGRKALFATANERVRVYKWCKTRGLDHDDLEVKLRIRDEIRKKDAQQQQNSPTHEYYADNPISLKNRVAQAEHKIAATKANPNLAISKSLKAQLSNIVPEPDLPNAEIPQDDPDEPDPSLDPAGELDLEDPNLLFTTIPKKKTGPKKHGNTYLGRKIPQNHGNTKTSNSPAPYATNNIWNGEHFDESKGRFILKKGSWFDPITQTWKVGQAPWENDPRTKYFYWYHEFVLNDQNYYHPDPMGACHLDWGIEMESGIQKLVMLCPRDHFKTTFCNIGYILFHICERQSLSQQGILNISWDDELALTSYFSIKQNLTENQRLIDFYGYLVDEYRPCTQNKLYFVYQPSGAKPGLFCASFKAGRITGTHPFLVFLDDIQDEVFSEAFMRRFKQIIQRKILPALGKYGRIMVTGTIKGFNEKNDGYLWLETIPSFRVKRYPAANDMPPMTDVKYELKYDPVLDALGKQRFDSKGHPIFMERFEVTVQHAERYTTLYPERYKIEDFVVKRLEMAIKEEESDDIFWSEYFLRATNPEGRFFMKKRIGTLPPQNHATITAFLQWLKTFHQPVYLWVDPGGKGSHGCAIAVVAIVNGQFFVLDLSVARAGLPDVAKVIGDLFVEYGVQVWGCEGNFDQAETYAATLDRELKAYLTKIGKIGLYVRCNALNNKGDKILRIQGQITTMIGIDGTPIQFFVNPGCKSIDQFRTEIAQFPDTKGDAKHEFDLLDCIASTKIHLYGKNRKAAMIAGH